MTFSVTLELQLTVESTHERSSLAENREKSRRVSRNWCSFAFATRRSSRWSYWHVEWKSRLMKISFSRPFRSSLISVRRFYAAALGSASEKPLKSHLKSRIFRANALKIIQSFDGLKDDFGGKFRLEDWRGIFQISFPRESNFIARRINHADFCAIYHPTAIREFSRNARNAHDELGSIHIICNVRFLSLFKGASTQESSPKTVKAKFLFYTQELKYFLNAKSFWDRAIKIRK